MKKIIINYKVIILGLLFFFVYIGIGALYFYNTVENLYHAKYSEVSDTMKKEAQTLIAEKKEAIVLMGLLLAQNHDIKKLLLEKNETDLGLDQYSLKIKENTPLQNIWFHVVDNEGVSRYRSWNKERGDSIVHIRKDAAEMLKNPKVNVAVSVGKFDMTFKSLVPIYEGEEFIGSVETIGRFNSIGIKLEKDHFKTAVFIDKKYKKQLTHTADESFYDEYFLSFCSEKEHLLPQILEYGVEHFIAVDNYYIDSKNQQLFTLYRVLDIYGENMGYLVMALDLKHINIANVATAKKRIIVSLTLGFLIISGFLAYLYMVNYKNFIQAQQKKLEESVAQKTFELRKKNEAMNYLAHHDVLTNLPNRLYFEEELSESILIAQKENTKLGVLFLDLDSFKEVNDTYGHKVGDLLLVHITKVLKNIVRKDDFIARLGGDEFTVIVKNSSQEVLEKVAHKIIREVQKPIPIDGVELFVTFSIGVSLYPDDGETTELLLKYADTAMYRAKEDGKNRFQFYNYYMTEMTLEKVTLQNALREAIAQEQFEPYYQPKIDARTQKVVGLEALVRWIHPEKGVIPPVAFIAFAEESGLIKDIDMIMLRKSLRQVKEWHNEGVNTGKLSLNVSTKQLQDLVCVECFEKEIKRVAFDTQFLAIEVTEGQIMKNQKKSKEILSLFRDLGISISIDDFGTGYSSLSYLKHLPVDKLKIDRSFIIETPQNKGDVAIVKTIIALAKNLQLEIIAEGVESKEQVDFLTDAGCYIIQGFYYSQPLSAQACREYLIAHS